VSINTILQDHTPDVQAIAERLRALIRATVPDAIESAHAVWHSINFTHPESGYFCGIFPRPKQVTLVFEFGVLLPDPDHLLDGWRWMPRPKRTSRPSWRSMAAKRLYSNGG